MVTYSCSGSLVYHFVNIFTNIILQVLGSHNLSVLTNYVINYTYLYHHIVVLDRYTNSNLDNNKFIRCSLTQRYFIYHIGYKFRALDHQKTIIT